MTRLLAALLLAAPLVAQDSAPRDRLLVTAAWLAEHLDDDDLVLLHVGRPENYEAGHIPGAHFVSSRDLSNPNSHSDTALVLELPEPEALEATLESLGITDQSRIVVYWADEWVTATSRVVFTLQWAGLGDRTVMLNGGLTAWTNAGGAVTTEVPEPGTGNVTVRPDPRLVTDHAWIQEHGSRDGATVLDGRSRAFYDGVRGDSTHRGHIPGAGSLPWQELLSETVAWRSDDELRAAFAAAGVEEGDVVVVYCHIGQYATAVIFAARLLGYDVMLYDGAFQDWARRNLPVTIDGSR